MAYSNPRAGGIIALTIDEGDELIATRLTDGNMDILLASANGKSIRFPEKDVRPMGRPSRGVRGMMLEGDDYLIGMEVVTDATSSTVITSYSIHYTKLYEEYRTVIMPMRL